MEASLESPATHSAVVPTPRSDLSLHEAFVQRISRGNIQVIFFGDSITARWTSTGRDAWKQHFSNLDAVSFGVGGDKTQNLLWRMQNGELEGVHPRVAVLLIGTNNLKSNTGPETVDGIKAIVAEMRKRIPETKILLLGILPRGEMPEGKFRATIREINEDIAALDDGSSVFYLDIGQEFLRPDGTLSRELMPDFLHPSAAGYAVLANALVGKLGTLLGKQQP